MGGIFEVILFLTGVYALTSRRLPLLGGRAVVGPYAVYLGWFLVLYGLAGIFYIFSHLAGSGVMSSNALVVLAAYYLAPIAVVAWFGIKYATVQEGLPDTMKSSLKNFLLLLVAIIVIICLSLLFLAKTSGVGEPPLFW